MGLRRGRSGLEGSPHKQKGGCANPRKAIVTPLQVFTACPLYTSAAVDDSLRVDLGGRRII